VKNIEALLPVSKKIGLEVNTEKTYNYALSTECRESRNMKKASQSFAMC
jgi:hypothetical protein